MRTFLEVLNHPVDAFRTGSKTVSWGLVAITILLNTVFEPILRFFCSDNAHDIDIVNMLKLTVAGFAAYIVICLAFWLICKLFGSKSTLSAHINTWGMTFVPTAICSVVVAFTEVFFFIFWNSTIWGMLINIVFVGILIWKAILFFLYLKDFAGLKGWRFICACAAMGVVILVVAALDGYVGLKTPII